MKTVSVKDIINTKNNLIHFVSGDELQTVKQVSTPEFILNNSLVFISKKEHLSACLTHKPSVVIALKPLLAEIQADLPFTLLSTENFKAAMNTVLTLFDDKLERFKHEIHNTAFIGASSLLGKNVRIGPHSSIGENVVIEDNVIIGPNCIIENNAKIGQGSLLHGFVFVGARCEIGSLCEIHPHTTIGSDGFGYFTDSTYSHHKIPQIGKVVIEDEVEIGANCCIDRATLTETRIKKGTKIDNLCHFAHNCIVGENSLIAAGFFVAGSSQLGQRFTTGGNSVVSTHLEICDGVTLAGKSAVTNDITEPGQYGGYPLQKLKDALKTISSIGKLVEMRKQLSKITTALNLKTED